MSLHFCRIQRDCRSSCLLLPSTYARIFHIRTHGNNNNSVETLLCVVWHYTLVSGNFIRNDIWKNSLFLWFNGNSLHILGFSCSFYIFFSFLLLLKPFPLFPAVSLRDVPSHPMREHPSHKVAVVWSIWHACFEFRDERKLSKNRSKSEVECDWNVQRVYEKSFTKYKVHICRFMWALPVRELVQSQPHTHNFRTLFIAHLKLIAPDKWMLVNVLNRKSLSVLSTSGPRIEYLYSVHGCKKLTSKVHCYCGKQHEYE